MRTIVDLTDEQIIALKSVSDRAKLSRAELLRRAVDEYLLKYKLQEDDSAFGLWSSRDKDGLEYQNEKRKEWEQ